MESVIENRLDRLQFTLRGAALSRTLRMWDALCTGLPPPEVGILSCLPIVICGDFPSAPKNAKSFLKWIVHGLCLQQ